MNQEIETFIKNSTVRLLSEYRESGGIKKAEFYSWAHTIAMLRDNNTADYDELYHTAFNELREQLNAAGIKIITDKY